MDTFVVSVCPLDPDSSDFGDVCALHAPFLHQLTMQSSLFERGCPVLVVVCVARKLRPCPSYSRRRDCINLGRWRGLYKGGGGVQWSPCTAVMAYRCPQLSTIDFIKNPVSNRSWLGYGPCLSKRLSGVQYCPSGVHPLANNVQLVHRRPMDELGKTTQPWVRGKGQNPIHTPSGLNKTVPTHGLSGNDDTASNVFNIPHVPKKLSAAHILGQVGKGVVMSVWNARSL